VARGVRETARSTSAGRKAGRRGEGKPNVSLSSIRSRLGGGLLPLLTLLGSKYSRDVDGPPTAGCRVRMLMRWATVYHSCETRAVTHNKVVAGTTLGEAKNVDFSLLGGPAVTCLRRARTEVAFAYGNRAPARLRLSSRKLTLRRQRLRHHVLVTQAATSYCALNRPVLSVRLTCAMLTGAMGESW
jgi:hypothetical protein